MQSNERAMGLTLQQWAAIWPAGVKKLGKDPATPSELMKIRDCEPIGEPITLPEIEGKLANIFRGLFA